MDITGITLEKLLDNPFIKNVERNGEFYFSQKDMNIFFGDNFLFTKYVTFKWKDESNFQNSANFIPYKEIAEQVEHVKNSPSFEDTVRKIFKENQK